MASFNDIDSVARLLDEHPDEIAGMIIEPIMMNAGIIHPEPGYLAALKDLLHSHGALLTFDEVKTGLTAGPAGATGLTGVVPDITCLAKAIGGGIALAAIGGTAEVMEHVAAGDYEMVGTFNGARSRWPLPGPCSPRSPRPRPTSGATPWPAGRVAASSARSPRPGWPRTWCPRRQGLRRVLRPAGQGLRGFLGIDDRSSHAHWLFQPTVALLPPSARSAMAHLGAAR